MKLLGTTTVDSGVKDQELFKFSISGKYWGKNGSKMAQSITYLEISRNPTSQSGGKNYRVF
jgi:hypothetical protein